MMTNKRFFVGTNDWEIECGSFAEAEKMLDYYIKDRDEGDYDRIECLDEVIEYFDEYHIRWMWDIE